MILETFKGIKGLKKENYRFIKYLKMNGIKDDISLADAKKNKNIIIPAQTDLVIKNMTDFKKETIFVYDIPFSSLIKEGNDLFMKGVPLSKNQDLNSVCTKCPNLWLLLKKLVSIKDTGLLLKIPNDKVNTQELYYRDGLQLRIKPEFNRGIAIIERNNKLIIDTSFFPPEEKTIKLAK